MIWTNASVIYRQIIRQFAEKMNNVKFIVVCSLVHEYGFANMIRTDKNGRGRKSGSDGQQGDCVNRSLICPDS